MKEDFDPKVLAQYSFRHQPKRYLYVKLRKPIMVARRAQRMLRPKGRPAAVPAMRIQTDTLKAQSPFYQQHGYAEVPNFLDDASYAALKAGWPPRMYFNPSTTMFKSYDFGFKWLRGGRDPEHLGEFPAMARLYELLRSKETADAVTAFCGDGIPRTSYSIAASWAAGGSALIPHKDGIEQRKGGDTFLNFILFVDANGAPEDCGGTAIYERNNYDRVLLRPASLHNTVLTYRSDQDIYHGFEPLKPGKFRWAILAQFAGVDYPGGGQGL